MRVKRQKIDWQGQIVKLFKSLLIVGAMLIMTRCGSNSALEETEAKVALLQQRYAPDRRTDRFDVEVDRSDDHIVVEGYTTQPKAKTELEEYLQKQAIPYDMRITSYPDSTVTTQSWGVVHLSVCNIRSEPKHSGELATQEVMGTSLRVLSRKNDWYLIQTPNGYLGWLDSGGFLSMNESQHQAWIDLPKRMIKENTGTVYTDQNKKYPLCDVVAGCLVAPSNLNKSKLTLEVLLPDGRKGYIDSRLVAQLDESLISTGQQFLGIPYLWGGTSPKGFDCSGFTKTVFSLHGYLLPRDASQQVRVGKEIKTDKTWNNLLPGDLLFFGRYREDGSEKITHVAMYLEKGQIIHATGRVKIESLNPDDANFANDRYDTFIKAKRMIENGMPGVGVKKM